MNNTIDCHACQNTPLLIDISQSIWTKIGRWEIFFGKLPPCIKLHFQNNQNGFWVLSAIKDKFQMG